MESTRSRLARHLVFAALACMGVPASAAAIDVAPGWTVETYASGFESFGGNNDVGPIGVAFDGGGNLFVTVPKSDSLHKIPPGGGTASNHVVRRGYGVPAGLAWDRDGRLYMARRDPGDVIEISPTDGNHIRTVASGLACAIGLATDPVSGDLFVSTDYCPGGGIMRLSDFADGPAKVSRYAGEADADGITFAPDGTLYLASKKTAEVLRVDGTNTATPGRVSKLADVPNNDGIAVSPASGDQPQFLLVARTDGIISRVDMDGSVSTVATDTTRGDLVTVGPDNCMYVTVSRAVLKVGPSAGPCGFARPAEPDGRGVLGVRFDQARVTDLGIRTLAPREVRRGRRFTVRMRVRNNGPRSASAVLASYTIPRGASLVRAKGPKGVACKRRNRRSRVVQCRKAVLEVGKTFTARLLLKSHSGNRYSSVARVTSRTLDNVLGNNRSRKVTRVIAPSEVLGVTQRGGRSPANAGRR